MQLDITLDSGATVSYIKLKKASKLNLQISPNDQLALLADQKTRMASLGEVDFIVTLNDIQMRLRALVMKNLQADCFGGTTFHADNGLEARIKDGTITIHGKYTVFQSNPYVNMPLFPPPTETTISSQVIDMCESNSSRQKKYNAISLNSSSVVLPSDYLHIPLPDALMSSSHISISPSFACAYDDRMWFPQI